MQYIPKQQDAPYILAAIRERILFQQYQQHLNTFIITHESPVWSQDKWDTAILSGSPYLVEVKVRDQDIRYDDWIFEHNKWSALIQLLTSQKAVMNGTNGFYCNIFRDGVILWNPWDTKPEHFFERDSKVKTMEDKGRKVKLLTYLKKSSGTQYNYYTNIPAANEQAKLQFKQQFPDLELPEQNFF